MRAVMEFLVTGLSLGGTYALIALGLVLTFRATQTLNFAYGELMVIAAFLVARWQATSAAPTWLEIVVAMAVAAVIAALIYVLVLKRMTGRPLFLSLIATFGLAGVFDGVLNLLFGSNVYPIRLSFLPRGAISLAGARVGSASLLLTGFTLLLAIGVLGVVRFTAVGLRLRAAGQDPLLASQTGIPVRWYYVGSWAAAGLLAAIAGIVYGAQSEVAPSMSAVGLAAFPAIILGGIDSIEGAVVGGALVGIVQGCIATYLGGQYETVVTYALLLLVLLFKPQGLFGTRAVVRA